MWLCERHFDEGHLCENINNESWWLVEHHVIKGFSPTLWQIHSVNTPFATVTCLLFKSPINKSCQSTLQQGGLLEGECCVKSPLSISAVKHVQHDLMVLQDLHRQSQALSLNEQ